MLKAAQNIIDRIPDQLVRQALQAIASDAITADEARGIAADVSAGFADSSGGVNEGHENNNAPMAQQVQFGDGESVLRPRPPDRPRPPRFRPPDNRD